MNQRMITRLKTQAHQKSMPPSPLPGPSPIHRTPAPVRSSYTVRLGARGK